MSVLQLVITKTQWVNEKDQYGKIESKDVAVVEGTRVIPISATFMKLINSI